MCFSTSGEQRIMATKTKRAAEASAPTEDPAPTEADAASVVTEPTPEDDTQPDVALRPVAPEHVTSTEALQRWIVREYPDDLHEFMSLDNGYYAGSSGGEIARLLYYSGIRPKTEAKLRDAAQRLDEQGIPYEWAEVAGYKCLRVRRYTWPEPGECGPRVTNY
jgi:hypothetical protein